MIALLLAAAGMSAPLDPCRATRFSARTVKSGPRLSLGRDGRDLQLIDAVATAAIPVFVSAIVSTALEPGFEVSWQLDDGTRVTLVSAEATKPRTKSYAPDTKGGLTTQWTVGFPLTAEAIHALASSPARSVAYTIEEHAVEAELTGREARSLQTDFACLANHLPRVSP